MDKKWGKMQYGVRAFYSKYPPTSLMGPLYICDAARDALSADSFSSPRSKCDYYQVATMWFSCAPIVMQRRAVSPRLYLFGRGHQTWSQVWTKFFFTPDCRLCNLRVEVLVSTTSRFVDTPLWPTEQTVFCIRGLGNAKLPRRQRCRLQRSGGLSSVMTCRACVLALASWVHGKSGSVQQLQLRS